MAAAASPARPPARILCVEDEPSLRELLSLHLRRNGFEVETAEDGLVAWHRISQAPAHFQVVMTDNQMPHLGGIELAEKLRANGFAGEIVFFSSTLAPQNAERLAPLRVAAIVEKGRPISELVAALHRVVGQ
jgi:two-component system, OmpR family, response regulator